MIQQKILAFSQLDKTIRDLSVQLAHHKKEKEKLSEEIVQFCQKNSKSKINLPDGSHLRLNKSRVYQNLSFTFLEDQIRRFNAQHHSHIPAEAFVRFLKQGRHNHDAFILEKKD